MHQETGMNFPSNARGCLLIAVALNIVAVPARGADAAATATTRATPATGVVAGKAAASSVARPPAPRAPLATDDAATHRPAQAERPKTTAKRHATRRTQRDEYGVVLEDGSYSLFYNY
jgi:hypothetical protein